MAQMPRIGPDPFKFGDTYNKQMTALGSQNEANAQNTLMSMFKTEAARQQPWNDLPVDLAKQNNAGRIALGNAEALADYKNSIKPALAPAKIGNMIRASARTMGFDSDIALTVAQLESNFDPRAVSPTGAKGVFQVTGGYAKDHGIANPFDAQENIDGAMRGMVSTARELQAAGLPADAGTIYLAHQQGVAGAKALLSNPDMPAIQALTIAHGGDVAAARRAFSVNGGRQGMTARAFANMWMGKANSIYKQRAALRARNKQDSTEDNIAQLKEAFPGGTFDGPDGKPLTLTDDEEDDVAD